MAKYRIAVIPGDGIGPEITSATIKVLDAVQEVFPIKLDYVFLEAGDACFQKRGVALPEETVEAIKNSHVCLKGPVGENAADVVVKLRMMFDLYANIRPIKSYTGAPCLRDDIDLVFVRENTEDLHKGFEFMLNDEAAIGLRVISKKGSARIARKALNSDLILNR
jgi:3-isopropylmalate dehydrogenase